MSPLDITLFIDNSGKNNTPLVVHKIIEWRSIKNLINTTFI